MGRWRSGIDAQKAPGRPQTIYFLIAGGYVASNQERASGRAQPFLTYPCEPSGGGSGAAKPPPNPINRLADADRPAIRLYPEPTTTGSLARRPCACWRVTYPVAGCLAVCR